MAWQGFDLKEWERAMAARLPPSLLEHVRRVRDTAVLLARQHGADERRAALAGLVHDYAKPLPGAGLQSLAASLGCLPDPADAEFVPLLHAPVGAALLRRDFGLQDEAVLEAVRLHTTGGPGMSLLARVIYMADYVEPARAFPGIETVRDLARRDLDRALLLALDNTIHHVVKKGWLLHIATVATRNWLLQTLAARSTGDSTGAGSN